MISQAEKTNFETLKRAISDGNAALMEVTDNKTGELVTAICAVSKEGSEYVFSPFAVMVRENPFERFTPPSPTEDTPPRDERQMN